MKPLCKAFLTLFLTVLCSIAMAAVLRAEGEDESATEDQAVACATDQHFCGHVIAMFGANGASAPPYVDGRCLPKSQSCGEYWCGNRQCGSGFFGTPSVCCIQNSPGQSTEYRCAYSELSCPGNTQQLSIRDHPARS
jgi:hypothetical protein